MSTWDNNDDFRDLIKNDKRVTSLVSDEELQELFKYENYTKYIDDIYTKADI